VKLEPKLIRAGYEYTEQIIEAALGMLDYSPAPQMRLVQPGHVRSVMHLARLSGRLYAFGDFGIFVDVGSPWYTTKQVLIEELIVRFRRVYKNPVEGAIAQLDGIGKEHGCVAVAAGDTQIGYMTPRYLAAGFQVLGTQFYKEIA
jgi:hypothetical protein